MADEQSEIEGAFRELIVIYLDCFVPSTFAIGYGGQGAMTQAEPTPERVFYSD
jgi:hypothetical protein